MTTFESYSDALNRAAPFKKPFTGSVREAIHSDGKLADINKDGQTNLADALDDGQLTHKEYNALCETHGSTHEDRAVFNQALAHTLAGKVPGALPFVEQVTSLAQGDAHTALYLYGPPQADGYEKVDVVTGHLQVQVTDRNGFGQSATDDLNVELDGSLTLKTALSKDLTLPPIASPYKNGIQFAVMGVNLLSMTFETKDKDSLLVVTPPSPNVLDLAQTLGLKLPDINEKMVADMLGVPISLVKKDSNQLTVSMLDMLKHKSPKGLSVGGQHIQLNALDLSGLKVEDIDIQPGQAALKLTFAQVSLGGGSGDKPAQGQLNQQLTMKLAMKDLNLTTTKDMAMVSSAQIELNQIAETLERFVIKESKGQLKEVKVTWQDNGLRLSAQGANAPIKADIPVQINGTSVRIDCTKLRVLGLPVPLAAARLNQYLSNATPFQSRVEGNALVLDTDHILVKQFPNLAQTHRLEAVQLQKGTLALTLTRNPHHPTALEFPKPQTPVYPQNMITPLIGATTQGDAVVGLSYTRAIPLGKSPIGRVLGLKPETGTLPHLSYSYLDNTYSTSANMATDGTFRGDVSTGLRASANPVGIPVYAQFEPLGLGIAANKNGTHAYLPMKVGAGYDNGRWTGGLFYQHNFGIGGPDDNIIGAAGGLRW